MKLGPLWHAIRRMSDVEQTIVVIPSLSLDAGVLEKIGPAIIAYEERLLFLLLLLRQPRARLVFVSSVPIDEKVVDYYLSLMPGVIPSHARRRLFLVSAGDPSLVPLSEKILARRGLAETIRSQIVDPERAHIVPFIATELERDLALALGIPMYGADPKHSYLGSKSGGRGLFAEAGIPHPRGYGDLHTLSELVEAFARLRRDLPHADRFLIKQNEGVSGVGNATVDLAGLPPAGAPDERESIETRISSLEPQAAGLDAADFLKKVEAEGGIVEELVTGQEIRSPSVQLRVTPLGDLEVLSTHDQLLGGRGGQIYMGCLFPADPAYSPQITASARSVGHKLAKAGVIGRFALDFVVARRPDGKWDHYAVEVNLRKGGTTHPYLTLQFLTDGSYDPEAGVFTTPSGRTRCLVATDHVDTRSGMGLDRLFEVAVESGVHFDNSRQEGVVFHMLGGLRFGQIGMTCVARSLEEARVLYDRTRNLVG